MPISLPLPRWMANLALSTLFLTGCGEPPATSQPSPAQAPTAEPAERTAKVVIDNFTYAPPTLTVSVGTKVTWVNHDDVPHTVTSTTKPRLLDSRSLDTDESFSHTFTAPGTYNYFCTVHPKMTGQVIVK